MNNFTDDDWGSFISAAAIESAVAGVNDVGQKAEMTVALASIADGIKGFYKAIPELMWKRRRGVMEKWIDVGTKNPFRPHELDAAIEFEKRTKRKLKPSMDGGDFQDVLTGKIFDHLGMGNGFKRNTRSKAIKQFKKSLDRHVGKLSGNVDELLLDLKGFTPDEIKDMGKYIDDNYLKFSNKINIINNK